MVHFLQLTLRHARTYNPSTSLISQRVLPAQKSANHDRVDTAAVESHKSNTPTIITSRGWFIFINKLHRFEFWSSAQRAHRKCSRQQGKGIGMGLCLAPHFAHQVNHVRVVLPLPVKTHNNVVA